MEEDKQSLVPSQFLELSQKMVEYVWGEGLYKLVGIPAYGYPPLVILLISAGVFFTLYLGFPQLRFFKHAIDIIRGKYDNPEDQGEISHFQALCTALSATVGIGNIAGVAVALALGGPGAIFWLWVAGFIGMATKFTEVSLALMYREVSPQGVTRGGPMYTIKNGLSKVFHPLAGVYAVFIILSSMGAGNMFQANQMASTLETSLGVAPWLSGLIFCIFASLVLIGGIKRIGQVAGSLVPLMVVLYFLGALGIVLGNISMVPAMFAEIFNGALYGTAAVGGFSGVMVKEVIARGIQRAVFSNEAGMGSAAMAHCAAKTHPLQEGMVALLEPLVDTIIVCTITAMALMITGVWHMSEAGVGADMTAFAFDQFYGPAGRGLVTMTVVLFAFSTIISWSYYGEQGATYLFGEKSIKYYRASFIFFIFIGAISKLEMVLNFSDAFFGMLAFPNILACALLIKKLKGKLQGYSKDLKEGKIQSL